MGRLSNKTAIVTGGGRDIGRSTSIKLAEEGAKVCINYFKSEAEALKTQQIIKDLGGEAVLVQGDMTKFEDITELVNKCVSEYGNKIDILVNNSGGLIARKLLDEMDILFWENVLKLNLTSTFLTTQIIVPHMPPGSSIINLSSQAARDGGGSGASAYAAAKGGVLTFTKSMAKELGPKNIRVNAVSAGMINTTFHDTFTKPEIRQKIAEMSPLKREGEPEEVADLICYLASDESSYITGASIEINGGLYFI